MSLHTSDRLWFRAVSQMVLAALLTGTLPVDVQAGEFTVFGPKRYVRDAATPQTTTDTFEVLNSNTAYTLRLTNGSLEDTATEKVSSSVIALNGIQTVGPDSFNQNVTSLEFPVTLSTSNTLSVELRSKPGGSLTGEIVGIDAGRPTVDILTPADGAVSNTESVAVQMSLTDDIAGLNPATFHVTVNGVDHTAAFPALSPTLTSIASGMVTLSEGDNTIQVSVEDQAGNAAQDTAAVTVVTGNRPPILAPIGNRTVPLGSSLQLTVVASDPDHDPVTLSVSPLPLPPNATFNAKTGRFAFTPAPDQIGSFQLLFTASDGAFTDTELVTITVEAPPIGGVTALTGRLLDTNDFTQGVETPVVGAIVSLLGTGFSTTSDPTGRFTLTGIPSGSQILDINTATATPAPDGSPYAGFREEIELIAGVTNVVERPFFLPRIARESLTSVDPTQTTIVENPTLGVRMAVPPFTAMNPDGSFFIGELSISEVPEGLAPAALPEELKPGMLITIQPVGVTFATPVPITFPNLDHLTPDSRANLWSLNPASGTFVIVGQGRVSADGSRLETISGGIRAADWHFPLPPAPPSVTPPESSENNANNQDQRKCTDCPGGSRTAVSSGSLTEEHALASYRSLGQSRALRLVYHSLQADPHPIISANSLIPAGAAIPITLSSRLSVGGVEQGVEVFTETSGLSPGVEVRQVRQFDASGFATGVHRYQLRLTSNYPQSSIANTLAGKVLVHNQQQSPFGAGWTLEGVGRLQVQPDRSVLVTDGDGSALLFTPATPGTGTFSGPTSFPVGDNPSSVAVGDFNGDTLLDLAVANFVSVFGDVSLSILLGDGKGAFVGPANFAVGGRGASVAVGDFNGDTLLDLAVVTFVGNTVSIVLGDGTGAFSGPTKFTVGSTPIGVAVGDFDGDTLLDLAVVNRDSATVSILLGDGNGSFSGPTNVAVGSLPIEVDAGDFNGDALLDLAVANGSSNNVSILLGDGTGAFTGPTNFAVGSSPRSVAVGDFNGDTLLDLAVANGSSNNVSILLGDGNGSFSSPANFAVGRSPTSVAVGDFNGDTLLDLAVGNGFDDTVSILLGEPGVLIGFQSPPGDFSTLKENTDGTFTRTLKDRTQVNFDARGLQTSVAERNGHTTTYAYDPTDRLERITDPVGLVTRLTYLGDHLSSSTDPAGRTTVFDHDTDGNLLRIIDPDGSTRQFTYDARHRLRSQTSQRNLMTTYDYNVAGRNIQANLPDGSTRKISPSETIGLVNLSTGLGTQTNPAPLVFPAETVATFTDGNGHVTRFTTDRFGASTSVTDALTRQTTITRDANGNPIRLVNPNGAVTTLTYDARGNLRASTQQSIAATTAFTYEPTFNQVTAITDPNGNTTQIAYDAFGNPTRITDAFGTVTEMTYDGRGLLTSVTSAKGKPEEATTTLTYDAITGNLLTTADPLGHTTTLTYDPAGDVATTTDAAGHTTRFAYDALNRLTQVTDPDLKVTSYTYDPSGHLTTVADANGHTTTFAYDAVDRLTQTTNSLGEFQAFAYDANGNLTEHRTPNPALVRFTYDAVNQLQTKVLPTDTVTFAYDLLGNLTLAADADSKLTFQYDPVSRLTQATTGDPLNPALLQPPTTLTSTYDKNGNRTALTDPQGGVTTYTYDALNRLKTLTNPAPQTTTFTYDPLNRRTLLTHAHGVTTASAYDLASQLLSLTHQQLPNPPLSQLSYTYDSLGNRLTKSQDAITSLYAYDTLNRLLSATNPTEAFSYDAVGNRDPAGSVYDAANRLLDDGTFTYTYDPNGNRRTKTEQANPANVETFTYDAENQLISFA
ncbi:MAG: VCBS repeat-containing protein, partial [Candidatus Omnitrophica bacterium]|nr:VCBS repeat-containing protein [Candidatus Omnitrophota bacterium]